MSRYSSLLAALMLLLVSGLALAQDQGAATESDDSSESESDEAPDSPDEEADADAASPPQASEAAAEEALAAPAEAVAAPAEAVAAPAPPPAPAAKPTAGWKKGFFIQSADGKFKLKTTGRVQVRYALEAGLAEDGGDPESAFSIPRARIGIKGHLFDPNLAYVLEIDFGKGGIGAKKAYMDYTIKKGWLAIRAGHYKKPFSRQQLTSSAKQALVDRAITDKAFSAGYDIGLMLHNGTKERFEWAAGLFNGTGVKPNLSGDVAVDPTTGEGEITSGKFSNVPDVFDPMVAWRVGYNHAGIKGYDSVAFTDAFGLAVGASGQVHLDADASGDGWLGAEVDAIVKVKGLMATGAFYLATAQAGEDFSEQGLDRIGLHAEVGYLIKGLVQPTFRYARVMETAEDGEVTQELGGGIAVLCHKHHVKWTTDLRAVAGESLDPDSTTLELQSQLQVSF